MAIHPELGREAPNYKLVINEVNDILKENAVISPPIFPKELCENYGIKVLFASFPDDLSNVMGFCDFDANEIVVNENNAVNRQTFTIAHEFGHYRLHKEYFLNHVGEYRVLLRSPVADNRKDVLEQEANAFAAHLLVPRKMLEKYSESASIREMARLFIVSEDVIRWRLVNEKLTAPYTV